MQRSPLSVTSPQLNKFYNYKIYRKIQSKIRNRYEQSLQERDDKKCRMYEYEVYSYNIQLNELRCNSNSIREELEEPSSDER